MLLYKKFIFGGYKNMSNNLLIKNARFTDTGEITDILILNGLIAQINKHILFDGADIFDAAGNYIAPGFIDLHAHLRDPGLTHKEDIISGTKAAVNGGFTTVCCMPNTEPCADGPEVIKYILEQPASCRVLPVGAITKSQQGRELTDFAALKRAGAAALSDDGKPVASENLMREALIKARELDILIMPHCEDLALTGRESEDTITKRDINLAQETGAKLHIAHVSTKTSAGYIAEAKKSGFDNITAETCPHYFVLTGEDVSKYGVNAKMNPPLRTPEDRDAIISALKSGAINCISTDHAPHSTEEKNAGMNGITGLETAFALGVTYLVKKNHIPLAKLIELMTINPAKIIGIDNFCGAIAPGKAADFVIFDISEKFIYDKNSACSKSRNTPFHGFELYGKILLTVYGGKIIPARTCRSS